MSFAASITFSCEMDLIAQGNIIQHGTGKQEDILQHHADVFPKGIQFPLLHRNVINLIWPLLMSYNRFSKTDNGGFAAAGMPHDGNGLPRLNGKADIFQNRSSPDYSQTRHCQIHFSFHGIRGKMAVPA